MAFVTNYFSGEELDAVTAEFFKQVVKGLRLLEHQVTVFTLSATAQDCLEDKDILVGSPDLQKYGELSAWGCAPVFSWTVPRALELKSKLEDELKDFAPDVILCVKAIDGLVWVEDHAPPVALLSVTPQFEIMRLNFDKRFTKVDQSLVTSLEILAFRSMSAISTPSEELRNAIADIAQLSRDSISTYRPSIEVSNQENSQVSPPHIVYVGTMERYKGFDVLMHAVPHLVKRFPDLRVTFAGETPPLFGDNQPYHQAVLSELDKPASKSITIKGPLSKTERRALLLSATVAVFPFRYCGCMYHVLEAMSAGACVVCTKTGSIQESLTDGSNCVMVAPEDEQALANAITRVLENDSLRQEIATNARNYVEKECSLAASARDIESLCLQAIHDNELNTKRRDPAASHLISAIQDFCGSNYKAPLSVPFSSSREHR